MLNNHHSLTDWDFELGDTARELDDSFFISAPTSLHFSPPLSGAWNSILCRIPATLCLPQGEIRTWLRRDAFHYGPSPAIFRNQAPLGTAAFTDAYCVFLGQGIMYLSRRIAGGPVNIASWDWWPADNTWTHVRTFWYNGKTPAEEPALCVDFYVEDAGEWIKIEDTKYNPVNQFKDSDINRCGLYLYLRPGMSSWYDDTEIWGPV